MKKHRLLLIACSLLMAGVLAFLLWNFRHEKKAVNPSTVVFVNRQGVPIADRDLTLDIGLQKIVEEELDKSFAILQPKKIIAILADPRTGKILAMAKRTAPEGVGSPSPQGDVISFCYEPGRIGKR